MRRGTRGAGADRCREGGVVGSSLVKQLRHPPHELPLRASDERLVGETGERLVEDRPGAPDRRQLRAVLHLAQPLYEAAARYEVEPTADERLVTGMRQPVRLEPDSPGQSFRKVDVEVPTGPHGLDTADRLSALE